MSYVRWGEEGSHVYVIVRDSDNRRALECVGCSLPYGLTTVPDEFLKHIQMHSDWGDTVPSFVEKRIRLEKDIWGQEAEYIA